MRITYAFSLYRYFILRKSKKIICLVWYRYLQPDRMDAGIRRVSEMPDIDATFLTKCYRYEIILNNLIMYFINYSVEVNLLEIDVKDEHIVVSTGYI